VSQWREQQVVVPNPQGLHVRPAQRIAEIAQKFQATITISRDDGKPVNAKSPMNVLQLSGPQGIRLTIRARGADAPQALAELVALVERGFDEM